MNYSSFVPSSSITTMLELLMTRNCKILKQGSFKRLYIHEDFNENWSFRVYNTDTTAYGDGQIHVAFWVKSKKPKMEWAVLMPLRHEYDEQL